jgi:three-Cys-motif partner protein
MPGPRIDEIGPWSEVKLDILKRYAVEYSKILSNQRNPSFFHVYIDAFAGAGFHLSEKTGEMVLGSPLNALLVRPPFREYHLVDLDGDKIAALDQVIGERKDVFLHEGNCNEVLLRDVFPKVLREDFKRGLCLLDPYGLTLDWKVIQRAGEMQSLDIFINFPIYDININVLHRDPGTVLPLHVERMNKYWGDESWRSRRSHSRCQCATAGILWSIIYSSHPTRARRRISSNIFLILLVSTDYTNVPKLSYRMDRRNLESRSRLHQDQSRLQALLCRNVCGALSRGQGSSL